MKFELIANRLKTGGSKDDRLQVARNFVSDISGMQGVNEAVLDDWTSNATEITAFVYLIPTGKVKSMRGMERPKDFMVKPARIINAIKKLVKSRYAGQIGFNYIEAPKMQYETTTFMGKRDRYPVGYDPAEIKLDFWVSA